jgi:transposase InsO family protein
MMTEDIRIGQVRLIYRRYLELTGVNALVRDLKECNVRTDRAFAAPAPNRRWIADFTYVWTAEGWLYVAAVIDLFSRRVVGWSMSAAMTAQLVTDALVMAIWRRSGPDALLHHSESRQPVHQRAIPALDG